MPERPDLEYQVPLLHEALRGKTLGALRAPKPVVLRLAVRSSPEEAVAGLTVEAVRRHLHFVVFELGPVRTLVVHPMLSGRFRLAEAGARAPRDLAVAVALDDGHELWLLDSDQMAKAYVVPGDGLATVPGFAPAGVDVLGPSFTRAVFRDLARSRRDQVRVFLMDKAALDAMGNAYADEVLFAAGIHPKTMVRDLELEEVDRLHDAIVRVLDEARATVAGRAPTLDAKVRDFLKVRNRKGEPCPVCGEPVRVAGVHGHDACFCARCQPDRRSGRRVGVRW